METLKTKHIPIPNLKKQVFEVLETDEAKIIFFGTNNKTYDIPIAIDKYLKDFNSKTISGNTVLFREYLETTKVQNRCWCVNSFFSTTLNKNIYCNVYENKDTTKENRLISDNETKYEKIYMIAFPKI